MFGSAEILVAAVKLTDVQGITQSPDDTPVTYFHLLFDRHEIILANGALTESLLVGPNIDQMITGAAFADLKSSYPKALQNHDTAKPARPIVERMRDLRPMIRAHQTKRLPLVCDKSTTYPVSVIAA